MRETQVDMSARLGHFFIKRIKVFVLDVQRSNIGQKIDELDELDGWWHGRWHDEWQHECHGEEA